MQNNSIVQLKIKANQFIEGYEKQTTEREYQKQKLKQNIMLQIMSNRHKSKANSSSFGTDLDRIQSIPLQQKFKKSAALPISQTRNISQHKKNNQRSNSVPNAIKDMGLQYQQNTQKQQLPAAQITFKMQKNTINFQTFQQRPQYNQSVQQENYEQQPKYMDQNQTVRQSKTNLNKSNSYKYQINQNVSKIEQNKNKNSKFLQRDIEVKSYYQNKENQRKLQVQQQIQQQQHNGPIFLTVDQDQSVQASHDPNIKKNYAFEIPIDKTQPIENIDELRKRKIEEMQKKRLQRMNQFKKQQQSKKLLNNQENKRSSSILKGSRKTGSAQKILSQKSIDQIPPQLPKQKNKKIINIDKQQKQNYSYQNIKHQSHYNIKPPQRQRASYLIPLQKESNQIQTPKTIYSEYRNDKSKGKNTIFRQSPKRPDKSASKYSQDPKIQPKDRKNTFMKQSNKKLMITAISSTCFPGQLNRKQRQKLIEVIEKQQAQFFVFLFKEYSRKVIKAIYVLDSSQNCLQKIYGDKAPQQIYSQNVQSFYRFDSGSKEFKKLDGCKSFSLVVHAIDLA